MALVIIQSVLAVLIIGAILLQMQGNGLAQAFGGSGEFYRSKRSVEKFLFYATIILISLFTAVSLLLLLTAHK